MSVKPQQIQELIQLLSAGQLIEVERKAKSIVLRDKSVGVAWELLGLSLLGQRKPHEALPALETAVKRMPKEVIFHVNLGQCLGALSRFEEAAASVRAALALQPGDPRLRDLLGTILAAGGKQQEALEHFRAAATAAPKEASIRYNLGKCLEDLKREDEAEAAYRSALELKPDFAAALHNLGRLLQAREDWAGAETAFRGAIACDPTKAEPLFHLGQLAVRSERWDEAVALFDGAVTRDPRNIEAYRALCYVYVNCGDFGKAKASLRQILEIDPKNVEASFDLANILMQEGRHKDAELVIEAALAVQPESNRLLNQRAGIRRMLKSDDALALSCEVFERDPTPENAMAAAMEARRVCDWGILERLLSVARDYGKSSYSSVFDYLFDFTPPAEFLKIARSMCGPPRKAVVLRQRSRSDRLKIGVFSADMWSHACGNVFAGVAEAFDRQRVELILFEPVDAPSADDPYRQRYAAVFEQIVSLADLNDLQAAERIADTSPDLILDMMGWTAYGRQGILSRRPAPIQAQWLGFPGTMGAAWTDYSLVDHFVAPPGAEAWFSEKLVRMAGSYQPVDAKRPRSPTPSRASLGLPETGVVFCSFNNTTRKTREMVRSWMHLLAAVDGSVLWQQADSEFVVAAMRNEALSCGIDPARLVFAPMASTDEHFNRIAAADIALDTYPYTSHATGTDAMWAGVPLVALAGDNMVSRVSGSILHAAGLPELVAYSLPEYEQLAVKLALDADWRARLRAHLVQARTSAALFDNKAFADKMTAAFEAMVDRHRRGLPPDHIDLGTTEPAQLGMGTAS